MPKARRKKVTGEMEVNLKKVVMWRPSEYHGFISDFHIISESAMVNGFLVIFLISILYVHVSIMCKCISVMV